MILYLTSKANVNMLDSIELEQELPIKKLIGQFSLHSFVIKDMRHFNHVRYIAIDRKAVIESDEDMIQALMTFQTMYNLRVIVIAEGVSESSSFLHELLQADITNIAMSENIETILQEIKECFSKEGMQRFIHATTPMKVIDLKDELQSNEDLYQFDCTNIRIAVAGSDRRTGVTTTAMNLVYWINTHGGSACYLEANSSKHLIHILQLFNPVKSGNAYTLEHADFYITPEINKDYNFIVTDCGVLNSLKIQDDFKKADIRLLCGSAMPYEIPILYRTTEQCKELSTHVLGMFVPDNLKSYVRSIINSNIIFGDSSHDLFDSKTNTQLHYKILKGYIK